MNRKFKPFKTGLEKGPSVYNGLGAVSVNNEFWYGWSHSIVRGIAGSFRDMLKFRGGSVGAPSDRNGPVSGATSILGWPVFSVDGLSRARSSVRAWNGSGWHEFYRSPATALRIRNLYVSGGDEMRQWLWCDDGGDLVYIRFPLFASNPEHDTELEYVPFGEIITSSFDGENRNFKKVVDVIRANTDGTLPTNSYNWTTGAAATGNIKWAYQYTEYVGTAQWFDIGSCLIRCACRRDPLRC